MIILNQRIFKKVIKYLDILPADYICECLKLVLWTPQTFERCKNKVIITQSNLNDYCILCNDCRCRSVFKKLIDKENRSANSRLTYIKNINKRFIDLLDNELNELYNPIMQNYLKQTKFYQNFVKLNNNTKINTILMQNMLILNKIVDQQLQIDKLSNKSQFR